jgi:hypothetical protein
MTKQTYAKHHRIYDYKYKIVDETDGKGEKTGRKVPQLESIEKREQILPAKPRTPFTFLWDGLRVTVLLSDGQVVNKYKAFKRFCEERGGYGNAMREQNMMDPIDLPALTELDEDGRIKETAGKLVKTA